jgi:transglutaminase-like putative cysteine protease
MTAHAAPAGVVRPRIAAARGPVLPLALARGAAFVALATFGALHWMVMLEPTATTRAWYALGAGVVAMLGLLAAGRLPARWRTPGAALASLAAFALALLGGGVADELLRPDGWGELISGIGRGLDALPGARVPYRGLDQWTRTVIALGGTVLVVASAMLAFWPRRGRMGFPLAALVALVTLYAVPMVALDFTHEFLRGALLALLVLAFLRLEKLRRADMPAAAGLAALTLLLGLILAPALDAKNPWWDYETWALETAGSKSASFDWNHSYGPLHWPRDGRELVRIKAKFQTYWKAQNLDLYDGRAWRANALAATEAPDFQLGGLQNIRRWRQDIKVTFRNLRSRTFVSAGFPVTNPQGLKGVTSFPTGVAGIDAATRVLRRGDTYSMTVYTPNPSGRELAGASVTYGPWLAAYRTVYIPDKRGPLVPDQRTGQLEYSTIDVEFPAWGTKEKLSGQRLNAPLNAAPPQVLPALRRSDLWRSWQLVQQLKRQAPTPYQFVLDVEEYLGKGFTYSETPPKDAQTLDGFLFKDHIGYCQQYSGAEALLLRLAGIPARVATGFTSGAYDSKAKEWVVRDLDAHSWVEVWFPGYGWVTRDPTPAAAPSRRAGAPFVSRSGGPVAGDVPQPGAPGFGDPRARLAPSKGGIPWLTIVALALLGAIAAFLLRRHLRRRGLVDRTPLYDLQRALQRARLDAGPETTLAVLEGRFARTPAAAAFVRTLRDQRYRGRGVAPTGAQRRGLRHELARGAGPRGWLRAWWALPPRPRR